MAKKDAAAELADSLVRVLASQRTLGPAAYPLPLGRLVELTDPRADPETVRKAVAKKAFAQSVVVAQKKSLDSPLALKEDMDLLAGSPVLLEYVLGRLCCAEKPLWPVAKLKAQVAPVLKKPFEEALHRQIRAQALPPSIGVVEVK